MPSKLRLLQILGRYLDCRSFKTSCVWCQGCRMDARAFMPGRLGKPTVPTGSLFCLQKADPLPAVRLGDNNGVTLLKASGGS
jgi:hypothetical protein